MSLLARARVLAAIGLAAGCAEVGTQPVPDQAVTGRYVAIEFTVSRADSSIDLLAEGATVDLTLVPDGTVSGSLSAFPGGPAIDLAGRWTRMADRITLDQSEDTIIGRMEFHVAPGQLQGNARVGEFRFHLVLRREPESPGVFPSGVSSIPRAVPASGVELGPSDTRFPESGESVGLTLGGLALALAAGTGGARKAARSITLK